MSSELPSGPLPADIEETVANIMREEGVSFLTSKILRMRLEAKYRIEFSSHKGAIDGIITKLMQLPEFVKQLQMAVREEETATKIGGKGKKRSASHKTDEVGAKKTRGEKKPEDFPKRALSSYFLFLNDYREKVKSENPDMKNTEIVQTLGKMWAEASDAVKEKYKKLAEDEKGRFERELSEYRKGGGLEPKRVDGKTKKKVKDENAPKRPLSSYMFFSNDFRKKHPELGIKEILKAAGVAWKELTDEMKRPYEDMAQKDRERYQMEMAARSE